MSPSERSNEAEFTLSVGTFVNNELRVVDFSQSESMSRLFQCRVTFASKERRIGPELMIGQPAHLAIFLNRNEASPGHIDDPRVARYINGIVSRFEHLYEGTTFSRYEVEIVPRVWLLNFRHKSRIFQKLSTPEIITQVLTEAGLAANLFVLSLEGRTYPQREYCVQYRESEWNFLQRLMEEEGIFYFFRHGREGHVLIMGDRPQTSLPIMIPVEIPYKPPSEMQSLEHINDFSVGHQIRTGMVTLRDFEFKNPVPAIESSAKVPPGADLEHYDYPAQYVSSDKKAEDVTKTLTRIRLEEFQTARVEGQASAVCRRLVAGSRFKLEGDARDENNREYLITSMQMAGSQPESAAEDSAGGGDTLFTNRFTCIPFETPFRPERVTPKPVVQGSQTAIVVGPGGEEIYTDEHGRVKVHFHWDREGKFDQSASCWIRVSHPSAGGQYGLISLPRIGQEVIVDFMEGDPDMPIITGRVFNGDHKPPYSLPDEKTKMTLRSNSSLGGGGANELCFEDGKGGERVFLHAQKDLHIRVKNDRIVNIENNAHETIDGEYREKVGGNRSRKVSSSESIEVQYDRSLVVKTGDVNEDYGMNQKKKVGIDYHLKAGMNVVIEAGMNLTLKAGGILTIQGSMVNINSGPGTPAMPPSPAPPAQPETADTETPGQDHPYNEEPSRSPSESASAGSGYGQLPPKKKSLLEGIADAFGKAAPPKKGALAGIADAIANPTPPKKSLLEGISDAIAPPAPPGNSGLSKGPAPPENPLKPL